MEAPIIRQLDATTLAGLRVRMSASDNRIPQLWQSFMPRRRALAAASGGLYSVEVYDPGHFDAYDPQRLFDKWAAVAVAPDAPLPEGLERLAIPAGTYAVFTHRGPAATAPATYAHIFTQWLPASNYRVDERPHFALMPYGYRPDDPDAEETIWIPVRPR
ncbi:GyrI-like domain-containing protein [Flaviaesturariibacter amylovorans]|uniref:AraC effector-binding domain-containing protein n=1 Tax=Flaviaesturariibacter amylovorans TaxID=1084520 RepID=A0ABP8HUT3_9BACT